MGFLSIFYGNLLMRSFEASGFRGRILSDVFVTDVCRSTLTDGTRVNNYVSMPYQ